MTFSTRDYYHALKVFEDIDRLEAEEEKLLKEGKGTRSVVAPARTPTSLTMLPTQSLIQETEVLSAHPFLMILTLH